MTLDLRNRTAVITGAAAGIGLGAAEAFAAQGARVVLADLDPTVMDRAHDLGGVGVVADVCDDAAMADLASKAIELGEVGIVMANAGVAAGGRFDAVPIEEWRRLFDVNVLGVVRTIRPFITTLAEQNRGHVVITGSSAGLFSSPGGVDAPYSASKHAVLGIARALARQFHGSGVGVHLLAPRLTDTAFPRSALAWSRSGARVMADQPVEGADSIDEVIAALLRGLVDDRFMISLTPHTSDRLIELVRDGEP